MILLFLRGEFAADLEGRVAGDAAQAADPAALAFRRDEGEGIAVLERGDGGAKRPGDNLAPPGLDLEARPAVIFVGAPEIEAERDGAADGKLFAVAAGDRQVERGAAAGLGIAVFLQLVIIDRNYGAEADAADPSVVRDRARRRPERAVPFAAHRLFDRIGAGVGAEDTGALHLEDRKGTRLNSSH